ncbi:MAG: hypothetical protein COA71_07840 [SAR86 cluster bacterium]|uniref:DUF8021 domain-containing protein n=1 Tax=SAR86 cluster bacterium TaxID=2030880 RepID=A0A2A5CDI0_9GAMM|nr:hypothetical protein [bacterium AH-315-I11]PCJ41581.1 MAG: hypothetical protein COA71_07840 [SAR86 cluster bacterium]
MSALHAQAASDCDKECLENFADQYRAAYLQHDPALVNISADVKFTENNVELPFPDGSWDTVSEEVIEALTFSDPVTANVGFYTAIMQNDTQGFLAVRLKIADGEITEIEHILSTRRNLSSPPTPFADPHGYSHDPDIDRTVPLDERVSRDRLIYHADGYFSILENNTGEIRGVNFAPDASRFGNGMESTEIEKGFLSGSYRSNDRVRERDYFLVDEERGIVMARAFIDHKGVLDEFTLTDGTEMRSPYREPQTWSLLEMFKIKNDMITAVEATFIAVPYYMPSSWTANSDSR